jgi:sigma-54 dependent transcriptional regulator, acetoin dehydrogenase operon transcriptional activator AcoR
MCGVDPAAQVDRLEEFEVDPDTPLLTAARPVLRKMMEELGDVPLAVLLAGRDGLVLDVLTAEGHGPLADMARTRLGRRCTEELVGTNSIGTALELGRGVQIRGDEHYLESLRSLNCLGTPVENPISGRAEGVLSICGGRSSVNAGLGPFLSYAARDIRDRLLAAAPRRHLELLGAFEVASRRHRAVVVLGADLVLATPEATAVLEPVDHISLRERARGLGPAGVLYEELAELASGKVVSLTIRRCGGTDGGGVLVEIGLPASAPRVKVPRGSNVRFSAKDAVARELEGARQGRRRVLITGERGTGRTTAVRELAAGAKIVSLDCGEAARAGWDDLLVSTLAESASGRADDGSQTLVALEGIDALPTDTALRALDRIAGSPAWVVMTAPPPEDIRGEHAALVACCEVNVALQPLQARTAELPAVLREMTRSVADLEDSRSLRWTSEAIAALVAHPWPGNLHELRAVVQQVVRAAVDGCVTVDALPFSVAGGPSRALSPLQRSEREVIAATLRACNGNKVHVAAHLGISRTTLYKRLRELQIAAR